MPKTCPPRPEDFAPDIQSIEPPDFTGAGTNVGRAAVLANIAKGRNTWAKGMCHLEEVCVAGDKIVVFVPALARLKDHADGIGGHFAAVLTFRDGRITEWRSFGSRLQALDWAAALVPVRTKASAAPYSPERPTPR